MIQCKHYQKEGNDCVIHTVVTIYPVGSKWVVTVAVSATGSWVDAGVDFRYENYDNKEDALDYYNNYGIKK